MDLSPQPIRVPLIDAAIEVRFPGDARIEAWRGEFQQFVRDKYPLLFVPNSEPGVATPLMHYRFYNQSQTANVGLAIHSLALSCKEYPGWESFKSEFLDHWRLVAEFVQPNILTRVGVRFVNRFDSELTSCIRKEIEAPFLVPLSLSPLWHESTTRFEYNGNMISVQVHKNHEPLMVLIDLDSYTENVAPEALPVTLDKLHRNLEDNFFACLEDEYANALRSS